MQDNSIQLKALAAAGRHHTIGARELGVGAALLALIAAPWVWGQDFYFHLAIMVCINIVIVSGLSILLRGGQVSLCHGAFAALGAYASALLVMELKLPFAFGAAAAMLLAAAVAMLLGSIILRLKGVYFVLITFAFGELVRLGLLEWESLTHGANGLTGVPPASVLGYVFDTKSSFYGLAVVMAVLVVMWLWRLFTAPAGHTVDAVGENPALAEASGLSVQKTHLFAFVVASALAGLGGALTVHYVGYVSPESFTFNASVAAIIMLVVGGRGYILGPVVGALVMTPLPELFRGAVESQNIFYGCAVILMLRFLPDGLASVLNRRRKEGA